MSRSNRDDSGAVAANVAVLLPVVALFFLVVQASLWFYGRTVMGSAAQHGLDAARVENGTAAAGEAVVDQFLGQLGGVDSYTVAVVRSETEVTVTIVAEPIPILPFAEPPVITVELEAPVERVVE